MIQTNTGRHINRFLRYLQRKQGRNGRMLAMRKAGKSYRYIAKHFKISPARAHVIITGRKWVSSRTGAKRP